MKVTILTLFPELFTAFTTTSIIGRSVEAGLVEFEVVNIRDFSSNKHLKVDDYPYGGGAGMVMGVEPVAKAINSVRGDNSYVLLTSAHGKLFNQSVAHQLVTHDHIVLVCGHYEGVDARIEHYIDEQICIGDYILTGGELASMVITDAVLRLLPGVISHDSLSDESFDNDLLEAPQYTRPEVYDGHRVPEVLMSGHHEKIRQWRLLKALELTGKLRPDLMTRHQLTDEEAKLLTKKTHK